VESPAEAGRRFRNVLTGEDLGGGALPVGHALAHVPVALLDSGAA
jgi:maltooligosyltrehalose synthase